VNTLTILTLAAALAMDAFAVSAAIGAAEKKLHIRYALTAAFLFGLFQAAMPLIGFKAGEWLKPLIGQWDRLIGFAILVFIGGKMIYESFKLTGTKEKASKVIGGFTVLIILAFATSIDALAAGFTLGLITHHIFIAVAVIGLVTFFFSISGAFIGNKIGHFFENKVEAAAGIILIIIALKILLTNAQ